MAYALVKCKNAANVYPLCEYAIDTSADLDSLPSELSPGSIAVTANGAVFRLSASGVWTFDTSTYGGAADVLGELPHILHLTQGENSTLTVKKGAATLADGAIVYNGDVLDVAFVAATGYDVVCTVNGDEVESSGDDYTVGVGDDVYIETVATIQMKTLTITADDNTTVTVTSGTGEDEVTYESGDKIAYGTELTITAAAADNYTLATFTVNTVDKTGSNPDTHTVEADITVAATSALNEYTLTLTQGENTTLTAVAGETTYENGDPVPHGTELTITAAATEGHDLTTFTIGGVDSLATNPATHTMTAAVTVVTAATVQG